MNLSQLLPDLTEVPESLVDEAIWDTFTSWTTSRGINLYPAQEEASLGILAGDNVILATPTGSGKSMVANAAHFIALAHGQRSFYTAPIKALVSEKFFALCDIFGAENVGMMTGDATVNGNAPIIAATAEIVANIALRDGAEANIDQVVMDEFHYYSEPDRGWAWQVPLLELPKAQFLLMSATLGNTTWLEEDLTRRTGRATDLVAGTTRPVPLDFSYVFSAVHETIEELLADKKAPIYVVHFSQREAAERAQALTSLSRIITKEEKEAIAQEIGGFRFTTAFGKDLSKLLRKGIGIHHAGMLPKYRRLVERLAQKGLLKVICGTDTLGVGINVPIRTVLMTGLAKFDGQRQRILKSREFHQIAGRAGRAGYDTEGTVVVEAPEHEIDNAKARRRIGDDPKRLKKLKKKSAREGEVSWSEKTFARLTEAEPEQLTSQFRVSNSMLLNVLARHGNGYEHIRHLLRDNHDNRSKQNKDILTAIDLFRGLVDSGVVQKSTKGLDIYGRPYHLVRELPRDFALNQPLGPFALAALSLLDPEAETYNLDVISVFEAILDDPRQVLIAQQKQARSEGVILRYLTDAWRTLKQSIPDEYNTPELEDIVVWLGELIRQVDSSLVDEWAQMAGEDSPIDQDTVDRELTFGVEDPTALTANRRAFTIMVRNYMFRLVQLFALEKEDRLAELLDYLDEVPDFGAILDDYFDEYDDIDSGPEARGPEFFRLGDTDSRAWSVRQIIKDPDGDHAYQFVATVDLDASDEAGEVRLSDLRVEY